MDVIESLEQFLSCYYHQDFYHDFGSPEAAIDAFIVDNAASQEKVESVLLALKELQETYSNEESLRQVLFNHGAYYAPWLTNTCTAKQWVNNTYDTLFNAIYS